MLIKRFEDIDIWKEARKMFYHVWFVTKYRKLVLEGELEKSAKDIFAECIQRHGYKVSELETNKDHVHMLVEAKSRGELAKIVQTLKAVSAKEILGIPLFCKTPHFRVGNRHFWARRYGYREIAKSEIEEIREYIRNQKKILHTEVCSYEGALT